MNIEIGTDICQIDRLEKVLEKHGENFKQRIFTPSEISESMTRKNPLPYYAGRWAAKEAVAKLLGCGIGKNCNWTDIEIVNNEFGAPMVEISGAGKTQAEAKGVTEIKLSISHELEYAVAFAIGY